MKYTKGDWEVRFNTTVRVGDDWIASCVGSGKVNAEANAHLIAAAPELLDACKKGLNEMKLWESSESCDCPPEGHICGVIRLRQSIQNVEQAIAKAKGK